MNGDAECPRCEKPLIPAANQQDALECTTCRGLFVRASDSEHGTDGSHTRSPAADGESASAENSTPNCPACREPMHELLLEGAAGGHCKICRGTWFDGRPDSASGDQSNRPSAWGQFLVYSMTLPERAVRSTIGVAAGAAKETADFLVPTAFQSSKTYEIVVTNSLQFLTEDIGGVAGADKDEDSAEDYMARKAVGNFVDLAGLATLHVSPMWVLAIVSDIAYGSKTYVLELAEELKAKGLIDETSTIHNVDDVLDAVQSVSGETATLFDTPPISVDQLKQSLESTRAAITSTDFRSVLPESEVKQYWQQMQEIATKENVSLLGVSGALTMHTLGKTNTASQAAVTGIAVAGEMLNRNVIGHYVDSLNVLRERGFYQTVSDCSAPYVEAVWNNFSKEKDTWTEEVVSGRVRRKLFTSIRGWFVKDKQQQSSPQ